MKRILSLGAAIALLAGGTAYAVASDAELLSLSDSIVASEARCSDSRDALDVVVRANTRPLFRSLLIPVVNATSLAQAQAQGAYALDVLARPGPAPSVTKTLHEETRRTGSTCIQGIRRALAGVDALIE